MTAATEIQRESYYIIAARQDPLVFAEYMEPENFQYNPHVKCISKKYYPKHLEKTNKYLLKVFSGKIKRLIINMPPGYAKSDFVTMKFTAWYLGRNPNHDIIIAAYGASLAEDFSANIRDMINTEKYQQIFPGVQVSQDARAKSKWRIFVDGKKRGSIIGAGVNGILMGRRANLCIIDDPIKTVMEALSPHQMEKHVQWFRTSPRTRMHPGGAIIVVMTRWVEYDLSGRLLQDMKNGGEYYEVLKFPAIDKDDNLLWPERYDRQEVELAKSAVMERFFQAMYQQEPNDSIDSKFGAPNIQSFVKEDWAGCQIIAAVDPAYGGKASTAMTIIIVKKGKSTDWLKHQDFKIFVRGFVWNESIKTLTEEIVLKLYEFKVGMLHVEMNGDKGYSKDAIKQFWPTIKGINTSVNKDVRIDFFVTRYWENIIFDIETQPEYITQLLAYTIDAPQKDAVDSLALAMEKGLNLKVIGKVAH